MIATVNGSLVPTPSPYVTPTGSLPCSQWRGCSEKVHGLGTSQDYHWKADAPLPPGKGFPEIKKLELTLFKRKRDKSLLFTANQKTWENTVYSHLAGNQLKSWGTELSYWQQGMRNYLSLQKGEVWDPENPSSILILIQEK